MENNIITKEKEDKERKIKIDSVIDSIIKENKKYKLDEFVRDIFSEMLEKQEKEGEIIYLDPESEIEIFNIWENAIIRRVRFYTILNKEIKTYCTEKNLDYIMALYSIYIKNQYHYYCTYTNHKAYYDHDIKKSYFDRNYLMNFILNRIKDKYIGKVNSIPDIEDNIVNMFDTLDNNMDNQNGYFDITTAKEQNFKAFHCICIDSIVKFNSYTSLLEMEIKKGIVNKGKEESNTDIENNAKKSRETLKPKLSKDELTQVFNKLVEKKFISDDLELFLACFGFGEDNEKNITWKSSQVEFEIFVRELVQEEGNPVNKEMCLPRKKINCWFVDVRKKPIKPTPKNKISCGNESYQTYKIIHP